MTQTIKQQSENREQRAREILENGKPQILDEYIDNCVVYVTKD